MDPTPARGGRATVRLLKQALKGVLSDEELSQLYAGFDIVGDIAIVKIPESLLRRRYAIGRALLKHVKPLRTVLRQVTPVFGEYRIREFAVLAGEKRTTTIHREHGCLFKVDLAKVYFSPRLGTERLRIASQVRSDETVINLFGGVGPFSIIIAKKQPRAKVYSIDANPAAHDLAVENVRLNKVADRVFPLLGDCREIVAQQLRQQADRVLMPLPERALNYLDAALDALRAGKGTIHLYTHAHAATKRSALEGVSQNAVARLSMPLEIVAARVVREVGSHWFEVALDISVRAA